MAEGFRRYTDLLAVVKQRGHAARVLGRVPDGSPVIAVKCGGAKKPAIFIGSGSHATEHAGVVAAVENEDAVAVCLAERAAYGKAESVAPSSFVDRAFRKTHGVMNASSDTTCSQRTASGRGSHHRNCLHRSKAAVSPISLTTEKEW